jgi:hypothetical protein
LQEALPNPGDSGADISSSSGGGLLKLKPLQSDGLVRGEGRAAVSA